MRTPLLLVTLLLLAGCSGGTSRRTPLEIFPDMRRQPKVKPQTSVRAPVPGAIPAGRLKPSTGMESGAYMGQLPLALDAGLLKRGQRQFDVYCSVCHDRTGQGHGIVSIRSSWLPANLHDDRIRKMADGEIFNVASFGRRSMPGYRFQVSEHDRWAIVAYIRALQRSTRATLEDVPPELRDDIR